MGRFKKVSVVAGILVFLLIVNVAGARAAKAAEIEIDKIETDLFPDITVTMKVVSNGVPVSGLTGLDFKLNEEIKHKVLSDGIFIIQSFTVHEYPACSGKYTILYKAQPLNKSDREDHRIFKAEVSHKNNLYTASWNYTVRAISDRERARAYFTRGSAFLFDKKYPDARDMFKKALECEPSNKGARDGITNCEEGIAVSLYTDEAAKPFETRNDTRAKEAFNAVLKVSPEHTTAKEYLAKIGSFEEIRTQAKLDLEKAKKSFEEEKAKPQDKQHFETTLTAIQNILNNAGDYQAAKNAVR